MNSNDDPELAVTLGLPDEIALSDAGQEAVLLEEQRRLHDTLTELAYSLPQPPKPLDAGLKHRLLERVMAESGQQSTLNELLSLPIIDLKQRSESLHWRPIIADSIAEIAILKTDKGNRKIAFFVRAPSASVFPKHRHQDGETVLVLEGDFEVDGTVYRMGEQVTSPAQSIHQPTTSEGCLVFCISSMDDAFVQ